jgi:hypothetical protein
MKTEWQDMPKLPDKGGKMLDHSAVSILPFLLTFSCYLIVMLPLLLIWLPDVLRRQASTGQQELPDGAILNGKSPFNQCFSFIRNVKVHRPSHHGSINGADLEFIKACNADYVVVSTKSGVHDNVPHSTAMQRYRSHTKKKVCRTDIDGSLEWTW